MVSALQNVMNGGDAASDVNFDSRIPTACEGFAELPALEQRLTTSSTRQQHVTNPSSSSTISQQPRQEVAVVQENSENGTNWSAPAKMEVGNGDEEFQEWMKMLMDFNDVSSDYILQLP
nr:ethylene-responsive transcription factor ERF109-like [Ipomoea trifida]